MHHTLLFPSLQALNRVRGESCVASPPLHLLTFGETRPYYSMGRTKEGDEFHDLSVWPRRTIRL